MVAWLKMSRQHSSQSTFWADLTRHQPAARARIYENILFHMQIREKYTRNKKSVCNNHTVRKAICQGFREKQHFWWMCYESGWPAATRFHNTSILLSCVSI